MPNPAAASSSSPSRVVVRSAPELVGAIPRLLGFHPEESVVVVTLRDGVVDVTARVDVPDARRDEQGVRDMVDVLTREPVQACVVAIFSEVCPTDAGLPDRPLANRIRDLMHERGVEVWDRLFVRDGRLWSYDCNDVCCPPEGRLVEVPDPGGPLDAREVHETRAALEHEIDRLEDDRSEAIAREVYRIDMAIAVSRRMPSAALVAVRSAVDNATELSVEDAAALVVAVRDVRLRDALLAWAAGNAQALPFGGPLTQAQDTTHREFIDANSFRVWLDLVRRVPRDSFADFACVLAAHVWSGGDGARARIALERAQTCDPRHRLSALMLQALDRGLSPTDLQVMLRGDGLVRGVHEADAEELAVRHREAKGA